MNAISWKNWVIFLAQRYNIFLFAYKFFLKSLKKSNNKSSSILSFLIIFFIELIFEFLTFFKFSRVDKEIRAKVEKNYTIPRSTLIIQLVSIIYFLKKEKKLKNILYKSSLMDIGCGFGKVLFFFKFIFNFTYGVEINRYVFSSLSKNFNKKKQNVKLINRDFFLINIPKKVNFFYIFSPFNKEILYRRFINRLIKHSRLHKKKIYLILASKRCLDFFLDKNFKILKHQSFLEDEYNTYLLRYK